MLNSRSMILACLILILAVGTNIFMENEPVPQTALDPGKNDPDLYMKNASVTKFTTTGTLQHRIAAERFTHFPLTNITTLHTPHMTLFPRGTDKGPASFEARDRTPWEITSQNGRLLPKALLRDEIVELWDRVLAVQQEADGDFLNIRTDSLTVYPDTDYAETDQRVIIDDNSGRTTAAGMKAYLAEGRFIFFSRPDERVQTILLPVFESGTE